MTYRLISGMHASTNTHLAWNYHKDPETGKWSSNATVFNFLVGKYPDRIGNIYFTFVFMLRCVVKWNFLPPFPKKKTIVGLSIG